MKLRDKKTGEIYDFNSLQLYIEKDFDHKFLGNFNSLKQILEYYEDYTPKEPLIKDEDKLDTVKSFFALLGITKEIYYQSINNCFYRTVDDDITYAIDFKDDRGIDNIYTGRAYTIAELCGEEEE